MDIRGRPRLPAPDVDPAAMVTSDNIYSEIDDDVVDSEDFFFFFFFSLCFVFRFSLF